MSTEIAENDPDTPEQPAGRSGGWRRGERFPAEMEAEFQREMECWREHRMRRTGLVAVLLYGAFAFSDRVMVPDAYQKAWAIRFLLVIPLMLLLTFGYSRLRQPALRSLLLSASVLVVAVSLPWIAGLSRHPNALHYQTGVTLVILFGNIVLGLRLRDAVATSLLIALIYGYSLQQMPLLSPAVALNNWLFYLAAVVISLVANFRRDQDQRRAYHAHVREQARNAELRDAVQLLAKLSAEDGLTGIANRREFDRRLQLEWARAKRAGESLALVLVDVDCFKSYNDYYGHPAGDLCLQQVAAALQAVPQRSSDLVARFGGEEFVALLPATSGADALQLAQRMRQAVIDLQIPHATSRVAPGVTASFGVAALKPGAQQAADALLAQADAALYRAKEQGRNQVVEAA